MGELCGRGGMVVGVGEHLRQIARHPGAASSLRESPVDVSRWFKRKTNVGASQGYLACFLPGSPLELFPPFVTACVTVLQNMEADAEAVAAYRWSLDLVARMLVRQVGDGSTVVMKAINANSAKQMRKALASAPRGERAKWVLDSHAATKQMPDIFRIGPVQMRAWGQFSHRPLKKRG